jgi:hypothetical protein
MSRISALLTSAATANADWKKQSFMERRATEVKAICRAYATKKKRSWQSGVREFLEALGEKKLRAAEKAGDLMGWVLALSTEELSLKSPKSSSVFSIIYLATQVRPINTLLISMVSRSPSLFNRARSC